MQPRQIAIMAAAVLVAFAVAFGVGKATASGGDEKSGKATKAKAEPGTTSIDLGTAAISAPVAGGGGLPALEDKPHKKKTTTTPSDDDGSPTPTPDGGATPTPTPTAAPTSVPTVSPTVVPTATATPGGGGSGGSGGSGVG